MFKLKYSCTNKKLKNMTELKNREFEEQEYRAFAKNRNDKYHTKKKTYDFGRILLLIAVLNVILAVTMLILNTFVDTSVKEDTGSNTSFWATLLEKINFSKKENITAL